QSVLKVKLRANRYTYRWRLALSKLSRATATYLYHLLSSGCGFFTKWNLAARSTTILPYCVFAAGFENDCLRRLLTTWWLGTRRYAPVSRSLMTGRSRLSMSHLT